MKDVFYTRIRLATAITDGADYRDGSIALKERKKDSLEIINYCRKACGVKPTNKEEGFIFSIQ